MKLQRPRGERQARQATGQSHYRLDNKEVDDEVQRATARETCLRGQEREKKGGPIPVLNGGGATERERGGEIVLGLTNKGTNVTQHYLGLEGQG